MNSEILAVAALVAVICAWYARLYATSLTNDIAEEELGGPDSSLAAASAYGSYEQHWD